MLTSETQLAGAPAATAAGLTADGSDSAVDADLHPNGPALVAKALAGLSSPRSLPVARLDAVRVLALALIAALDCEAENDQKRGSGIRIRDEVQRFEANLIRSALKYTGGRQRRAARLLGMNVSTLNSRIKRYKLSSLEIRVDNESAIRAAR